MTKLRNTHRPLWLSLLASTGIYVSGWVLGTLIVLTFAPKTLIQQVIVNPRVDASPWYYISHNLIVEGSLFLGALTLGVMTCLILFGNGLFSGAIATLVSQRYGLAFLLVGLLPHGIPEVIAWILAGAASLMLTCNFILVVFHHIEHKATPSVSTGCESPPSEIQTVTDYKRGSTWRICTMIVVVATLLLVVAGMLEAYVSPHLLLGVHLT